MKSKKVVKSSLVVMSFVIIGKILAFIRDALIASKFGTSYNSDIYLFSIGLVYLLTSVSYGLTTTFIPIHAENLEKENFNKANKFVNNILTIYVLITFMVTIIGMVFTKYVIVAFAPGFTNNPVVFESSIHITRIMLLSLLFLSAQSVVTGVLQAHNEFYVPAAMATCSNIIYLIYLAFFAQRFGINGFAWATVVGFFVQLAINLPTYKRLGYKYRPVIDLKDKGLYVMTMLMIPVVISTSTTPLNLFVNRYFATNIGEGAVSALDYSNKLNTIVDEVFAMSISMVIYPLLSSCAAEDNIDQYKSILVKSLNTVLLVMIPAAMATAVLRYPLVTVIFKRGQFNNEALMVTAGALLYYTPAMVASGVRGILNKAYYSLKDTKTPMMNSFIGIFLNAVFSFTLMNKMKVAGLTLSVSIALIFTTLTLFYKLNVKLNDIGMRKIRNTFIKVCVASLAMGVVLYYTNRIVAGRYGVETVGSLISLIAGFISGTVVYMISIYFLNVEEFKYFINSATMKFKR